MPSGRQNVSFRMRDCSFFLSKLLSTFALLEIHILLGFYRFCFSILCFISLIRRSIRLGEEAMVHIPNQYPCARFGFQKNDKTYENESLEPFVFFKIIIVIEILKQTLFCKFSFYW